MAGTLGDFGVADGGDGTLGSFGHDGDGTLGSFGIAPLPPLPWRYGEGTAGSVSMADAVAGTTATAESGASLIGAGEGAGS